MKIGPKYKIARRLGAPIFEKTQTQKYALSLARKEKNIQGRGKPKSEFGLQLIEKQKARFSYGVSEKQFSRYAKSALTSAEPTQTLFRSLELRLDNILYRSGLAKSRAQGRQIASHGHALVNGRRVTIPSITLKVGDAVSIREGSKQSPLFMEAKEKLSAAPSVPWLEVNADKKEVTLKDLPKYDPKEQVFNLAAVFEFYSK